jgi:hypothetical protein
VLHPWEDSTRKAAEKKGEREKDRKRKRGRERMREKERKREKEEEDRRLLFGRRCQLTRRRVLLDLQDPVMSVIAPGIAARLYFSLSPTHPLLFRGENLQSHKNSRKCGRFPFFCLTEPGSRAGHAKGVVKPVGKEGRKEG